MAPPPGYSLRAARLIKLPGEFLTSTRTHGLAVTPGANLMRESIRLLRPSSRTCGLPSFSFCTFSKDFWINQFLVSLVRDSMTKAGDAREDFIGRLGPHEWPRSFVRDLNVPPDGRLQLARAAVHAD